ncbi:MULTISPECIES: CMD domain protein [unclassified Arthrobacter]|uniref:CMD domain protein n=1 Tax=unclassified Arthrobacter TaxID=235627 RepID=UPI001F429266|nr:CMD domain protein [Arthrobacter sp. FW305-BF8]UKA53882.1 CMD domain protein [Arthrobacter sp. FW305-BF8]
MSNTAQDAVDTILGVSPGSPLDELRRRRPVTRENTQASYLALFEPDVLTAASLPERFAVAVFVAALHGNAEATAFYEQGFKAAGAGDSLHAAVLEAAESGVALGPYGEYREPGLQAESRPGLRWAAPAAVRGILGDRLSSALDHAHLLVFRPREASPAALGTLVAAGWSTTGIVTLSQLVAFLAYQLRVVSGLRILAAALPEPALTEIAANPADAQTVRIGS